MKAFEERGLAKEGIKPIGPGDLTDDYVLNSIGDPVVGVITTHHYSAAHDSPENKALVAAFHAVAPELGRPNFMGVGGYDGMGAIGEVVEGLRNSIGGDKASDVLKTLPIVFVIGAALGALLERTLYRRLYRATHLDQVLFSIGLTFTAIAAATWVFGSSQQLVRLPDALRGQVRVAGIDFGVYRLFLIAMVAVITAALGVLVARTRFGAHVRAAVDDAAAARGLGIDVDRIFAVTFALGPGLAALGGALGIEVLGLDPTFALKFLVYFLIVVVVGGAGRVPGL